MGRRLNEYTRNNTKCMVEVNGQRLIDRLVGQLEPLHLRRLIIVVGYQGQNVVDHLKSYAGSLPIEFVENPIYDRTNNIYSLSLVKEQLQQDDTLLIESDLIFDDELLQRIVADPYPNLCLVEKYEPWMDGTMVCIDEECYVTDFVSKKAFNYQDVDRYYKTINIYKFSREFSTSTYVPFLDAYCHALGNNEYYEQVLRVITLIDRANLRAMPVKGPRWYEIDDAQDLEIAETMFAAPEERMRRLLAHGGGFWRYPKMLDFSHPSQVFFPSRQMLDELRANLGTVLLMRPSDPDELAMLAAKNLNVDKRYVAVVSSAEALLASDALRDCEVRLATWYKYASDRASGVVTDLSEALERQGQTVFIHDFAEVCGMPGLQLALVLTADEATLERVRKHPLVQAGVSSMAEFFLQIYGKYASRSERALQKMRAECDWLLAAIGELPHVACAEGSLTGVCFRLEGTEDPSAFAVGMLERHQMLLGSDGNRLLAHVRSHADNERLVEALTQEIAHFFG